MKGIILAGGSGTRLYPLTKALSKQLLPIYDKPMIYYSLSILMLGGIREILIISTPRDLGAYRALLGDGSELGLQLQYREQLQPRGLAEAFILGEGFIGTDSVCLILGDNLFYGNDVSTILRDSISKHQEGAKVFLYHVSDARSYGVAKFDQRQRLVKIIEKPKVPPSHWALVGLYIYDNSVSTRAKSVRPSQRGELEISSLNQAYLEADLLQYEKLGRGITWVDTGSHENLLAASNLIKMVEQQQGYKIACLEEIAFRLGYIDQKKLETLLAGMGATEYRSYLAELLREGQ